MPRFVVQSVPFRYELLHGPRPNGAWGPDHDNLVFDLDGGMLVPDVVDGVIRFVEVLDRPNLGWAKSKDDGPRR